MRDRRGGRRVGFSRNDGGASIGAAESVAVEEASVATGSSATLVLRNDFAFAGMIWNLEVKNRGMSGMVVPLIRAEFIPRCIRAKSEGSCGRTMTYMRISGAPQVEKGRGTSQSDGFSGRTEDRTAETCEALQLRALVLIHK